MTTALETTGGVTGAGIATATTQAGEPVRTWTRPHLLGLEPLSAGEIVSVLDTARTLAEVSTRSVKKVPALRGKVCVNLFFEDSTRTKTSFSLAAQRLSADVIDFSVSTSSVSKGETLRDTARNIEAMGVDAIIIRHRSSGAPHLLTRPGGVLCAVINAGDGAHEHPTQGLLDLFTMREHFTRAGRIPVHAVPEKESEFFKGIHVAIVGDIANSRVARSNLHGLCKLGAKVTLVGPSTLVPGDIRRICPDIPEGTITIHHDLDAVLPHVDVVNMLRIQFERLTSAAFPSVREYSRFFGLTRDRLARARQDILVLHPGPMNRGLEINTEVADGNHSAILQQVTNGLAVRMAVLYLCVGANTIIRGQRGN